MYRLIQGDVGSGKTIISLLTILDFIKSGFQCYYGSYRSFSSATFTIF